MIESCSNLSLISDPVEQCEFVRKNCQLESIIPYASFTYCVLSSTVARVFVLSFLLLLNFGIMGVAAFDYLSPNLTHVAEMSGLSQSLMGVTVLAFGNGSVDVFGALVALSHGEGGMAFGEIMGGALFVCSVVVGSMAIIKPFQIEPHFTLRDVAILGISIVFTLGILADGVVTLMEALMGLLMYCLYALFVVHQQLTQYEEVMEPPQIPQVEEPQSFETSPVSINVSEPPFTPLRQSLYSAVDVGWKVHQHIGELTLRTPSPEFQAGYGTNYVHERRRSSAPQLTSQVEPCLDGVAGVRAQTPADDALGPVSSQPMENSTKPGSPSVRKLLSPHDLPKLRTGFGDPQDGVRTSIRTASEPRAPGANEWTNNAYSTPQNYANHTDQLLSGYNQSGLRNPYHHHHHHHHHDPQHFGHYSMQHLVAELLEGHQTIKSMPPFSEEPSTTETAGATTEPETTSVSSPTSSTSEPCTKVHWLFHIFPSLYNWSEITWIHRLHVVVTFPIITLLTCSIPLSVGASSRSQTCIYAVGVPMLFPMIMPSMEFSRGLLLLQVTCAAAGLLWWGKLRRPLPSSLFFALVGFAMGLLWVLLLAKELVALLIVSGEVCHVSETMMGLTIFALGDSLGDLVSNLTVARIGFSTMAISACFGGPIFTLLVGVSGASLFTMLSQRRMQLEVPVTSSLLLSSFGLLVVLAFFAVSVIRNRFTVTKSLGIQLIVLWFIIVAASMAISRHFS